MNNCIWNRITIKLAVLLCLNSTLAYADANSDLDRNIKIIFPPDIMQEMLDQTSPQLLSELKYTDDADKAKTKNAVEKFHQEFLQNFQTAVTASLKQNFTPQEIAQWAAMQSTPLGTKTMLWLKTKYPSVLNQSMDQPMQDLYKNLGQ